METEISGAVFKVVSNPYNFVPQGKTEADRLIGVAHHVYVLDFGDGKTPDALGGERQYLDVRLSDAQMEALKPTKDDDVRWRVAIQPNGNKFRFDLVAPVSVAVKAAS